jgi:hypothetical protein
MMGSSDIPRYSNADEGQAGPVGQAGYGRLDQVAHRSRKRPSQRTLGAGTLASSACVDATS